MSALPQLEALRAKLREHDTAGFLTFDGDQQTWLCGFRAVSYTRPIVLFVGHSRTMLIVPELEERNVRQHARVDCVKSYNERPGAGTPGSYEQLLDALLESLAEGLSIAIDEQQLPLAVADRLRAHGRELVPFGHVVRTLIEVKHPDEIAAVRTAADLLAVGVRASLEAARPDVAELELDGAGTGAILAAVSGFGPDTGVAFLTATQSGVERTVLPHAPSSPRRLAHGDVLVHNRQLAIDGYRAELERTAFIGAASPELRRGFQTMHDAQRAAIEAIAPGVPASAVDRAARAVGERAGWGGHMPHRTGHGIAVGVHEPPSLRYDNDEPLLPGMILTVEPGIYVPGLGGFRHSDTVLVTDDGCELLTHFPGSLEEMTLDG